MAPIQSKNSEDILLGEALKLYEASFINLVRDRFGIIIHIHQVNELNKVILETCKEFKLSPADYLEQLKTCPNSSPIIERLVAGVTVGETYFFRDKRQIELLKDNLLPKIIEEKRKTNNKKIKIWSAACSSGEEIFTISMMLKDLLPDYKDWSLQLIASDINNKALEKAGKAHYSKWSMRSIPDYYTNRHFRVEGQNYILNSDIQNVVRFFYLNLNEANYPSVINGTPMQDLILCRNVLIYFDRSKIIEIMRKLCACLVDGGVLLLGASDPINVQGTELQFYDENGIYFKRKAMDQ